MHNVEMTMNLLLFVTRNNYFRFPALQGVFFLQRVMPGTPETFVQDTFITASREKLIVNWQQLSFSNEPNSVGAEHVNSLQSLKNFSKSFHPTQDMGRLN